MLGAHMRKLIRATERGTGKKTFEENRKEGWTKERKKEGRMKDRNPGKDCEKMNGFHVCIWMSRST